MKDRLIQTLRYLIERNNDVVTADFDEREYIEYKYYLSDCGVFYIVINNEFFDINCATTVNTAKKILSYIENGFKITYLCDRNNSFDTIVGDIDDFIDRLGIDNLIDYSYLKIIENNNNSMNLTEECMVERLLSESKQRCEVLSK